MGDKKEEKKEESPKIEIEKPQLAGPQSPNAMNNFLIATILDACSKVEDKFIDDAVIKIKAARLEHKARGKILDPNFFDQNDDILKNAINNFEKVKAIKSGIIKNVEIAKAVNEKEKILGKGSNKYLNEIMGILI